MLTLTPALWETFGEHRNIGQLAGHKSAVTCVAWVPTRDAQRLLVSGSADNTLVLWDTTTGERVRRWRGHRGIVNGVAATRAGDGRVASVGDDGRVLLWDTESRHPIGSLEMGYPLTCVAFSDDASQLYIGGVDNAIHVLTTATLEREYSLLGHTDSVASLALSPKGTHLLSTGLDDTARVWDVRPFAPQLQAGERKSARLYRTLAGMASGFEHLLIKGAWSKNGDCVACGSADHTSNVWEYVHDTDAASTAPSCCTRYASVLPQFPGHHGTCTAVDLHPREAVRTYPALTQSSRRPRTARCSSASGTRRSTIGDTPPPQAYRRRRARRASAMSTAHGGVPPPGAAAAPPPPPPKERTPVPAWYLRFDRVAVTRSTTHGLNVHFDAAVRALILLRRISRAFTAVTITASSAHTKRWPCMRSRSCRWVRR